MKTGNMRMVLFTLTGLAILMMCSTASAESLACYDTYYVVNDLSYPFDFATTGANGTLADCIELATMTVVDAEAPSSPAYHQWSAVGFDNGGSFVYTVEAKEGCCFDPDLLYAGGVKSSSSGPTSCTVTVEWIDCGDTEVQSAVIDSYTPSTSSYQNDIYDLDTLIPGIGCEELGCVEWLQVTWEATGASGSTGTFRIGSYYDGGYTDFGLVGECCDCNIPEPGTLAMLLTGLLGMVGFGRRQK